MKGDFKMKKIVSALLLAFVLVFNLSYAVFAAYEPEGIYLGEDVTGYRDGPDDADGDGDWKDDSASGEEYEVGYCAVHPQDWGDENYNRPIYPWGSIITLLEGVKRQF